jgi:transcriptional regulator with XRE-family HTH domain
VGVEFGTFLRRLRQRECLTQKELACRAGVSLRTLGYWESNEFEPREHELNMVLKALNANSHEQRCAVEHLTSLCWKLERTALSPETEARLGHMPGCGDLIHALRVRNHLTREGLARLMGITPSSISRWEKNETIPTDERVQQLCSELKALPEEQAALLTRRLTPSTFVNGKFVNGKHSIEEWEQYIHAFAAELWIKSTPLHGLEGLALAATAWRLATTRPEAELLLGKVYCIHSAWLMMNNMVDMAADYGMRGLSLLTERAEPERLWLPALYAICNKMEEQAKRRDSMRSIHYLTRLMPYFITPEMKTYLFLHIAEAAARSERHDLAHRYWKGAVATATEVSKDPEHYTYIVRRTEAHLHLAAGRPGEALAVLPAVCADHGYHRISYNLCCVEALLALGHKHEAHDYLAAAHEEIDHYDFAFFRTKADALAQQL